MTKLLRLANFGSVRSTIVLAFLLMIFGAVAAVAMTPRIHVADRRNYDLEKIIPKSFGGWKEADASRIVLPDPSANTLADKIYNKVLARTYLGPNGEQVMFVVAYGGDQSDQLQLHRPEICYAANGFHVSPVHFERRTMQTRDVLLTRLDTSDHYGHEEISYWMRVGDRQVTTTMDRQWVKLVAGLNGMIPDGVLVRISTRSPGGDAEQQYAIHDKFVSELLTHLDPAAINLLIGRGAPGSASSTAS